MQHSPHKAHFLDSPGAFPDASKTLLDVACDRLTGALSHGSLAQSCRRIPQHPATNHKKQQQQRKQTDKAVLQTVVLVQVEDSLDDKDAMLASLQQAAQVVQQQQAQDKRSLIAGSTHRGQLEGQVATLTRFGPSMMHDRSV